MKKFRFLALSALLAATLTSCDFIPFPGGDTTTDDVTTTSTADPTSATTTELPPVPSSIETKEDFVVDEVKKGDYYKNVWYADENGVVKNSYKVGGANYDNVHNVNNGYDYTYYEGSTTQVDPSKHNYDLIVPDAADQAAENKVLLFIHGGAWIAGSKDDMRDYAEDYANKGYITANMWYTKLSMDPLVTMSFGIGNKKESVYRMLDEIDACITSLKAKLVGLGFDGSKLKLVISGVSAGSHIMMLYAYSRGAQSAIPISFLVNAVGPVDIKVASWKQFVSATDSVLDAGITPSALEAQAGNLKTCVTSYTLGSQHFNLPWNDFRTMMYADSMCASPYSLSKLKEAGNIDAGTIDMSKEIAQKMVNHYEETVSVTHYISDSNKYPIISAYGGKDDIVGIGQYAQLETALAEHSVDRYFVYFRNSSHDLGDEADKAKRTEFDNKIDEWLLSK